MSQTHSPHRQDPRHCEACDEDVMPVHRDHANHGLVPRCPDCGRRV